MEATLPPIVILGTERSGSNLLRKLLGNHSRIAAPRPAHFYNYFFNHLHHYGPLSHRQNAARLYADVVTTANHSRSDWRITLAFDEFSATRAAETFFDIIDGLYRLKTEEEGKQGYFCKDNDMQLFALSLLHHRADTRFVHLCRDPRDSISSWLRNPAFFAHPIEAAYKWLADQSAVAALQDAHAIPIHRVRYEDLVSDTARIMTGVLQFAGLDTEDACFSTNQESDKDAGRVVFWENLNKPVMKDNFGKFREQLTPEQIEIIETICKFAMARLDYKLTTTARYRFSSRAFKLRHWWDSRRFRAANADKIAKNTTEVLDKNALVTRLIRARAREPRLL